MSIGVAALVTWAITAALGFYLVGGWLARRDARRRLLIGRTSRSMPPPYIPTPLIVFHAGLAAVGLVVWATYLLMDVSTLAWIAFATLLPVALLGSSMFGRWLGSRRMRVAPMARSGNAPAESRLPILIVAGHGMFGVVTVVLVLVSATGVDRVL